MEIVFCLIFICWAYLIMFKSYMDFLSILIYMEMVVVTVFTVITLHLSAAGNSLIAYTMVAFLSFTVCEAVVGLALLVSSARSMEYYSSSSFCVMAT
uniref:NADH dehydrogenase subunit 4L n=1 Tax=Kuphus polythalamius TaxID=1049060 RepID=UPI002028AB4E|nr:NADH dehydrogenase subunit 4L [Kuphus polythalamius]UPX89197.1 NADH dehydrogenase subunit 4L [Kuphus polythalamius]UPX89209.1 NADH dehydrogenase subunit 4L [Kuphus polythalamius]